MIEFAAYIIVFSFAIGLIAWALLGIGFGGLLVANSSRAKTGFKRLFMGFTALSVLAVAGLFVSASMEKEKPVDYAALAATVPDNFVPVKHARKVDMEMQEISCQREGKSMATDGRCI